MSEKPIPVRYVNDFLLRIDGPPLRDLTRWAFVVYDDRGREMKCGPLVSLELMGTAVLPVREETPCEKSDRS